MNRYSVTYTLHSFPPHSASATRMPDAGGAAGATRGDACGLSALALELLRRQYDLEGVICFVQVGMGVPCLACGEAR
jgi:hypothetical protein